MAPGLETAGAVQLQAAEGQVLRHHHLKTFDLKFSYPRKLGENFTIEPSVSVFNAFNNANFDLPGNTLRLYNWADYIGENTIANFEKATGIKVTYDTFDSYETVQGKLLPGRSG